jgi:hypothetical protein
MEGGTFSKVRKSSMHHRKAPKAGPNLLKSQQTKVEFRSMRLQQVAERPLFSCSVSLIGITVKAARIFFSGANKAIGDLSYVTEGIFSKATQHAAIVIFNEEQSAMYSALCN